MHSIYCAEDELGTAELGGSSFDDAWPEWSGGSEPPNSAVKPYGDEGADQHISAAEFQCRVAYLGMSHNQFSKSAQIAERSLRRWTNDDVLPGWMPSLLENLEKQTELWVKAVAARGRAAIHKERTSTRAYSGWRTMPETGIAFPESWWHHVVARAREINPGIRIEWADE